MDIVPCSQELIAGFQRVPSPHDSQIVLETHVLVDLKVGTFRKAEYQIPATRCAEGGHGFRADTRDPELGCPVLALALRVSRIAAEVSAESNLVEHRRRKVDRVRYHDLPLIDWDRRIVVVEN